MDSRHNERQDCDGKRLFRAKRVYLGGVSPGKQHPRAGDKYCRFFAVNAECPPFRSHPRPRAYVCNSRFLAPATYFPSPVIKQQLRGVLAFAVRRRKRAEEQTCSFFGLARRKLNDSDLFTRTRRVTSRFTLFTVFTRAHFILGGGIRKNGC